MAKQFVKVGLKSGAVIDIEMEYDNFIKFTQNLIEKWLWYKDENVNFHCSEIESISRAEQTEETKEITRKQFQTNIKSMKLDLQVFENYLEECEGDVIDVSKLAVFLEKEKMALLAKEPVELPPEAKQA